MKQKRELADWKELEQREANIKANSKFMSHLSVSLLSLVLTAALFQFDFEALKGLLTDVLFRTQPPIGAHPAISIVGYDELVSAKNQGSKKIPANTIVETILKINRDKPLAIALVTPFSEKIYTDAELALMSSAFTQVSGMFIGYTDNESLGKNPPRSLFHTAHYSPGYVSRDTFSYGADSVSRRVMLSIDGIPSVYSKLSNYYHQTLKSNEHYPVKHIEKFGDALQTYIRWQGPQGTYPVTPMSELLSDKTPPNYFKDKIVLIGTVLSSNRDGDFIFTPYSRAPFHTPLLEGAAHSLATLLNSDGLYKAPRWMNIFLALVVGLISVNCIMAMSPRNGLFFLGAAILILFSIARISFLTFGCLIDLVHPSLAVFIGYYFVIPYRLVEEHKKRWHYQEKSEFMAQLEQLKTNFLSLVSHDLKTPLAQIQGNAELALNDKAIDRLPDHQLALRSIIQTTDSLTNYVEGILDLTRIEGSKVHLNITSKDINTVIQEVVKTKALLASSKNIEIKMSLEPLFAFKFDVKLIQQVISNLIENAINYSPANSKVIIESKEEKSFIKISVVDEGSGIPEEEQEKIFTKFYRISNTSTENPKGTGLGLYLVKYFVELHQGFVTLLSEPSKGSTFTINLPIEEGLP